MTKKSFSCEVNLDKCPLTRLQEMSLYYHFSVEQEVGSSTYSFFGFNGAAGVWRLQALTNAGGWKDRTTVEDIDLAVKNELPSTYKAYKFQQHRWSYGPANLFRKMLKEIILCERVSAWKKFQVIYAFFFVRKIVAYIVTFFYCVIIPACVLVPKVRLHKFIMVYVPSTITILNAVSSPRPIHLLIFWIMFENVMSMHHTKATIIGLLEGSRAMIGSSQRS